MRLAKVGDMLRHVDSAPDYFGFRIASNQVWVRYGLAVRNGTTDQFSRAYFKSEPCGPRQWQRTEKESMIVVACCGFRN